MCGEPIFLSLAQSVWFFFSNGRLQPDIDFKTSKVGGRFCCWSCGFWIVFLFFCVGSTKPRIGNNDDDDNTRFSRTLAARPTLRKLFELILDEDDDEQQEVGRDSQQILGKAIVERHDQVLLVLDLDLVKGGGGVLREGAHLGWGYH